MFSKLSRVMTFYSVLHCNLLPFSALSLSLSISLQEQSLQAGIGVLYLLSDDFMRVVRLGRDISPYFVGFHQRASAYLCRPKESLLWRKHQGPPCRGFCGLCLEPAPAISTSKN